MAFGKVKQAEIDGLLRIYRGKKARITERLDEFKAVWPLDDKRIFSELCFCICTPQSKAVYCDKAINSLVLKGILFKGGFDQIRKELAAVRFPNNKARYILEARESFSVNDRIRIKERISPADIVQTRKWFVKNVKGIGFKEAGHFLRNIGLGDDLAILDVHILKNMFKYGVIKEIPKYLSEKNYFALEEKLKRFASSINIPVAELDLLFWSQETGEIFK